MPSEIKVTSASGGVGPYTYTLLPSNITNSSGTFTNVAPGTYQVRLTDACGNIRTRQATITPYTISATSTKTSLRCNQYEFTIQPSVTGPSLIYGYSINGSTIIWGDSAIIRLTLSQANITFWVRDACGTEASSVQIISKEEGGYIKQLKERIECKWQEIYPDYYGFNAPKVCLYKSPQNTLVECKQAPANYTGGALTNFFNLPFGQDYYVIVQDGCYRDSAFFKDKTSAGGVEMNPFNWKCSTFDLHADGNNSGTVCLYNSKNDSLIGCKSANDTAVNPNTGQPWRYGGAEWYDLPYGSYYTYIFDPCLDSLIRIDTTVTYPYEFSTKMQPTCYVSQSAVESKFSPESTRPHKTTIYYPNGSVAATYSDAGTFLMYPTWIGAGTITVVQEDGCGNQDTSNLIQPDMTPSRNIFFTGGCPGVNGDSGGGDLILSSSHPAYTERGSNGQKPSVTIIKKDGLSVNVPHTFTQWNSSTQQQEYFFTNLTTGVYIIESAVGCGEYKVYDTTVVNPYVYPLQEQTHILQCGINPFAFKDTITGGKGPYSYEITSTSPSFPSLLTGTQTSNTFSIPPGTNLNTITIQVIDACGNSNTKTYPVNHSVTCDPLIVGTGFTQEHLVNKIIKIFPNPSYNQFTIAFAQKKKTDYHIEIFNSIGIKVHSDFLKNVDTKNISFSKNYVPGTYVIKIRDLTNRREYYQKQIIL
ncbi:MAG: T9SS type A sorting domain-containing protein [Pedobacter sp.]|nr:MAG: T9SS type A sorting domain-containing protein [Pedobacter sp.]